MTKFIEIDSETAQKLFGTLDRNVRIIEDKLKVRIKLEGGALKIDSDNEKTVEQTALLIESLLVLIKRGYEVDENRVETGVALAKEDKTDEIIALATDTVAITSKGKHIKCKTVGQRYYVNAIKRNTLTFGIGPAGTGKTYLAVAMAVSAYKSGQVQKIIITLADGTSHEVSCDFDAISQEDFYAQIKNKKNKFSTAAPSPEYLISIFEKYVKNGQNVIFITLSSALSATNQYANVAAEKLNEKYRMEIDVRDQYSPGYKFNDWEMRGVPVRIELGPRDIENGKCVLVRRDNQEKIEVSLDEANNKLAEILDVFKSVDTKDIDAYNKVKMIASSYPGESAVVIKCTSTDKVFSFNTKVDANNYLVNELLGLLGEGNVVVK